MVDKNKGQEHPRVFISYSHDSPEHTDNVLAFANKLRSNGIDANIDQYEPWPEEGWLQWMTQQIRKADFTLMICTEMYYKGVTRDVKQKEKLGVKWEWHLISVYFYKEGTINKRFLPVLFKEHNVAWIPDPFHDMPRFCVETDEGYEELYRRLIGQPKTKKPELGKPRLLPELEKLERKTDFFDDHFKRSHQKIDHIKEITNILRAKSRQKNPHKCHNDEKAQRDCIVQKHSVGLAFEVKDFDSETNKTLEFLDALLSIELKSDEIGSNKSYKRAKYNLDEPVRKFFRILEIEAEEYFRDWKKDDDEELLKRLIEKSAKKLPVLKPARENALSMLEELSIFVRALSCYKLQRNVGSSDEQEQDFDSYDNIMRIKSGAATVRGIILSYLQSYLNENVELIDESVNGFLHPFKGSPPPSNPKPCIPIQEVPSPQKPKAGSKKKEKSK